jgi:oligopeptidase A
MDDVRKEVCFLPVPKYVRFQDSFPHIFSGGYEANYYGYTWAEVLASDAYAKFEENGIFDPKTASDFLHKILEKGGSEEMLDMFIDFRGREPKPDALLKHYGLTEQLAPVAKLSLFAVKPEAKVEERAVPVAKCG